MADAGVFTNRSGKIRIFDGTATAKYLEVDFDAADFSGPIGRPRTEELLKLDRGRVTADAHYIEGPEDKIMEPLTISFGALLTDLTVTDYLLDWLEILNGATATINGHTITTTKEDTQNDGSNNNPPFADSGKLTCNVEIFFDGVTTDQGYQYNEVYFPLDQCTLSEGDDSIPVALSGLVYGTIGRISAFTSGDSIEEAAG